MLLRSFSALALLAALSLPLDLNAQMIQVGDHVRVRPTGRLQVQFNTSSIALRDIGEAQDLPFSTFETRRARLGAYVDVDEWITSLIEAEFAGGDVSLRYAYIDLGFDPAFAVRIGRFKKPFSLLELTSSTRIPTIERGLRVRGYRAATTLPLIPEEQDLVTDLGYAGYDLGLELHGELGRFGYHAGVFNGVAGEIRRSAGDHALAARLTYRPLPGRPLTIGAGASYHSIGDTIRFGTEERATLQGTAFELDAEWGAFRREGFHLLAEAALGENLIEDLTFSGAQVIGAYFQPLGGPRIEGIEPVFRLSYGNAGHGRGGDVGWLVTPGFNLYFAGRNRLMFNWDLFAAGDRFVGANAFIAQAQIYF